MKTEMEEARVQNAEKETSLICHKMKLLRADRGGGWKTAKKLIEERLKDRSQKWEKPGLN